MKKIERDYQAKYGDISNDPVERVLDFLCQKRLTKKTREYIMSEMDRIRKIKWKTIKFTIYLVPKGSPRPRHNSFTRSFYVSGAKDNHDIFMEAFENTDIPVIETPCKFRCDSYLPIPSAMTTGEIILAEAGLIRPSIIPDWDNLGKSYSDMVQNALISNDALIIEGVSRKFFSLKPRIEVCIEYMTDYDSKFAYNKSRKKVQSDE